MDNDEEELLVQAALDSSAKGFPKVGACSSAVSASMVGTDERAGCSLWTGPLVCTLCFPRQLARSLGSLGSVSTGLHSAPTLAQTLVPVIILVSAKTFPPASVRNPASVSVQTANILPSGQVLGAVPGPLSLPCLPLSPTLSPVPGVAERTEGAAGSSDNTPCLTDSW